ncbi:MAG: MaoC family dehydratase N-terminal domain-containing protein [Dehalococcoidia bacterium]
MSEELYQALKALVGEESEPRRSNDDVNRAMIRHWCESLQLDNPLYYDDEYARGAGYDGIIMPPTMIQVYCLPVFWPESAAPIDPIYRAGQICAEAGYPATVGVSYEYEFFHPLYPGDDLYWTIQIASVSTEKTTRLGTGYFVTSMYSYTNQRNELISRQYMTVFNYKTVD